MATNRSSFIMKPEENVELKNLTTFKIGGLVRYFFRAQTVVHIIEALEFSKKKKLPFFVLGGGSNLLASDAGFSGVLIKNELKGVSFRDAGDTVFVTAGAGESWDGLVETVVGRGLYGLENLSGIPGTVGAAPVQNIGAYGAEAKNTIATVEALDSRDGTVKIFSANDCQLGYRDSFFKTPEGKNFIVTSVTFELKKEGVINIGYKDLKQIFNFQFSIFNEAEKEKKFKKLTPLDARKAVLEIRSKKFPDLKITGTAGSFFKNPIISLAQFDKLKKKFPNLPGFPISDSQHSHTFADSHRIKIPLAWILDNILHFKGKTIGCVGLYRAQPLVVVNEGGGTSANVLKLVEEVAEKVKETTGIVLVWEVERLFT